MFTYGFVALMVAIYALPGTILCRVCEGCSDRYNRETLDDCNSFIKWNIGALILVSPSLLYFGYILRVCFIADKNRAKVDDDQFFSNMIYINTFNFVSKNIEISA
jgi:hypothetical protein